jgi:excinuclease UvrABC ATPase subunit
MSVCTVCEGRGWVRVKRAGFPPEVKECRQCLGARSA